MEDHAELDVDHAELKEDYAELLGAGGQPPKPENFVDYITEFPNYKEGRISLVALATLLLGLAFWGFSGRKNSQGEIYDLEQKLAKASKDSHKADTLINVIRVKLGKKGLSLGDLIQN